jgi:hypothetical protein
MNNIQIKPIPNQQFSVNLNGVRFDITISALNGAMGVTIAMNGVVIIENTRATAGTFLLPYLYQENGNFLFFNLNDEIIFYDHFGATQTLVYLSPADLDYLRGP